MNDVVKKYLFWGGFVTVSAAALITTYNLWDSRPSLLAGLAPCVIVAGCACLMFRWQHTTASETEETRDIGKTCGMLAISVAGGFYATYAGTAYVPLQNRVAGVLALDMWCMAAYAVGIAIGFLFGIPRVLQHDTPGATVGTGQNYAQRVNTNLEQISDWLTKIIVGLGLVQLQQIPGFLKRVALWAAGSLPLSDAKALPSVASLITPFLIYFCIVGFLAGYLLTRLYLASAFRRADQGPVKAVSNLNQELADDTPFAKLRNFWSPGGKVDTANESKLVQWLKQRFPDVSLANFLYGAERSAAREEAVKHFDL